MAHHTLKVHDIVTAMDISTVTLTTSQVLEALEAIKDISEKEKAVMTEQIEEAVISTLQDVIDIPWVDTVIEWAPELIEILKLL